MPEDATPLDLTIRRGDAHLMELTTSDCQSALVAAGAGVEVIRHRLRPGARFGLVPEAGWEAFEAITVVSGCLRCISQPLAPLGPGATASAWPVHRPYIFEADEETVLLHISSQPMFEAMAGDVQRLRAIATEVARKDGYTHEHCLRVQTLAVALGRAVGLAPDRLHWLMYGAFLHDVGKSRVPTEIISKPGRLSAAEWSLMRRHPTLGREIVESTHLAPAATIIEQHHERLDGSGYPYGLSGDAILLESQIVSIADTFDAITTDRPYHAAESWQAAKTELRRCAGTLFRPDLVEAFVSMPELAEEMSDRM